MCGFINIEAQFLSKSCLCNVNKWVKLNSATRKFVKIDASISKYKTHLYNYFNSIHGSWNVVYINFCKSQIHDKLWFTHESQNVAKETYFLMPIRLKSRTSHYNFTEKNLIISIPQYFLCYCGQKSESIYTAQWLYGKFEEKFRKNAFISLWVFSQGFCIISYRQLYFS